MKRLSVTAAALCLFVVGMGSAMAQQAIPSPKHAYKEALAHCENLHDEEKHNCRRDAQAAFQAQQQNAPQSHHPEHFKRNQLKRCERLPEPQRQDCIDHMNKRHANQHIGSVQGGGVLRQSTYEVPAEPEAAAPTRPQRIITPLR